MSTQANHRQPRFRLGMVVITPGAILALVEANQSGLDLLERHAYGDWGDLVKEDWQANEQALKDGSRLFSAYTLTTGERIWIITEWDRSATTVLLPAEY